MRKVEVEVLDMSRFYKPILVAIALVMAVTALPTTAKADWDDHWGRHRGWEHHEWREHEWREHHHCAFPGGGAPYGYNQGYAPQYYNRGYGYGNPGYGYYGNSSQNLTSSMIYADQSAQAQYNAAIARGDYNGARHFANAINHLNGQLSARGAVGAGFGTPYGAPAYPYNNGYNGYYNGGYNNGYGNPYGYGAGASPLGGLLGMFGIQ